MRGYTAAANGYIIDIPMSSSGSTHCHMQQGYASQAVRVLQASIVECYGISIDIDGQFGSKTKAALVTVQKREKITADGVYGPNTRNAMSHTRAVWEGQPSYGCAQY